MPRRAPSPARPGLSFLFTGARRRPSRGNFFFFLRALGWMQRVIKPERGCYLSVMVFSTGLSPHLSGHRYHLDGGWGARVPQSPRGLWFVSSTWAQQQAAEMSLEPPPPQTAGTWTPRRPLHHLEAACFCLAARRGFFLQSVLEQECVRGLLRKVPPP